MSVICTIEVSKDQYTVRMPKDCEPEALEALAAAMLRAVQSRGASVASILKEAASLNSDGGSLCERPAILGRG